WTYSFIAACSSSVTSLSFFLVAVVVLVVFWVFFVVLMETSPCCVWLSLKQNSHRVLRVPITLRKNSARGHRVALGPYRYRGHQERIDEKRIISRNIFGR